MAAEAIVENGLIVRGTAGHRLYVLLQDSAEDVQPLAGDVADVLKLCADPKAKGVGEFARRVDAAKKRAREQNAGPQWVGVTLDCTVQELRDLLTAAGAKV